MINVDISTFRKGRVSDEIVFRLIINDELYEYHEKTLKKDSKTVKQTTTYLVENESNKSQVDFFESEVLNIFGNEVQNNSIELMCGPPCGYLAVIAKRLQ